MSQFNNIKCAQRFICGNVLHPVDVDFIQQVGLLSPALVSGRKVNRQHREEVVVKCEQRCKHLETCLHFSPLKPWTFKK